MDAFLSWFNLPAVIWLLALVFFLILEAATISMVSLWFAGGALVALVLSLFEVQLWVQITVFLVVSAVLLAALRPFVRKFVTPLKTPTNVDRVVGMAAMVTETIDNIAGTGKVRAGGIDWTARTVDQQVVEKGSFVKILRIEGAKLTVETIPVAVKQ